MNKFSWNFKRGLASVIAIGLLSLASPYRAAADVTISLDAGFLYGPLGAMALPASTTASPNAGALLLIVASASGTTFGGPVAGSFTSNNDVILGAAAFNTNNGTGGTLNNGGETTNPITLLTAKYPASLSTSNYVALYWFPGITLAQYNSGTKPATGTTYGAYNPQAINLTPATSLNPEGGNTWTLPPNPSANYRLNFFTTADFGATAEPEADGFARFAVAAVPEPSTYALLGGAMAGFLGLNVYRRRRLT